MEKPWHLLSASFLGFLASMPLAAGHLLLFLSAWRQYEINKKYGYPLNSNLHWDSPGQPWISICAFAFSILMMILAAGLLRSKEWARRTAIYIVAPCLAALLIATWVALTQTPPPPAAPLAVGSGIDLAIILFCLLLLVPIAVWWQILLTRPHIRSLFLVAK
jgi:hypothetical protein